MRIHVARHERSDFYSFWSWLFYRHWEVNKAGEQEWGVGLCGFVIDNEPKGGNL